jgi:hypothetical protein
MRAFRLVAPAVGLLSLVACETRTTAESRTADASRAADSVISVNAPVATGSRGVIDRSGPVVDAGQSRPAGCDNKTITSNAVGTLRIGLSVDSVKSICRVARDTTMRGLEGMMERRLVVSFGGDALDAEIVDGRVWRLDIRSPAFRTTDSLGVGSPIGNLSRLGRIRGLVGEGVLVVVSPDRCGLSFVLSGGIPATRGRNWDSAALAKLPRSTTVERVYVVGCSPPR